MTSTMVNERALRHASIGKSDSGTWSSPIAWLLGGKLRRRFTKLENKSPAMAAAAAIAPMLAGSPISGAQAVVTRIDASTPRTVFDGPNRGRPSASVMPPSTGQEKRDAKIFLAASGVPLASADNT